MYRMDRLYHIGLACLTECDKIIGKALWAIELGSSCFAEGPMSDGIAQSGPPSGRRATTPSSGRTSARNLIVSRTDDPVGRLLPLFAVRNRLTLPPQKTCHRHIASGDSLCSRWRRAARVVLQQVSGYCLRCATRFLWVQGRNTGSLRPEVSQKTWTAEALKPMETSWPTVSSNSSSERLVMTQVRSGGRCTVT